MAAILKSGRRIEFWNGYITVRHDPNSLFNMQTDTKIIQFGQLNSIMWLKPSLHADWYVAILKKNGRHLEFSNDQLRKPETSTETPFLKGSCVYHYVHDCYYILRLSARQNIFCSLRKKIIILISLVSIMWQKNAHVSLFILFYLYFLYIVDEGVMNHLIPNKQCMLLFLSFSSYICYPYPHS